MNRAELIEAIAGEVSMSKNETDRVLNAFLTIVEKNIKREEGIRLVGFGTFTVAKRKARVGRNPQTGEELKIPARVVPVFRPGSHLKECVNKGK